MAPSARFLLVSTALAMCAVVALFALAADQYRDINSADELESQSTVSALKAMLAKQAAMDKQEAGLFAALTTKKAAVHKAAAKKAKKPVSKDDEIAKLKAQLAAAESKAKRDKAAKAEKPEHKAHEEKHEHLTGLAKIKHDESYLTTGKEFAKYHGKKAKKLDRKIAKEAGLKDMGWMGSKSYIDSKLKALHCDPTNFMCTGTKAQKKEALKMIQKIQESITGDAQRVKAYAWKEEHALPPAPKM